MVVEIAGRPLTASRLLANDVQFRVDSDAESPLTLLIENESYSLDLLRFLGI